MTPTVAALVEREFLRPLDAVFAEALGRLSGAKDPLALLAAATVCGYSGRGHVCVDLRRLGGLPVTGWEGEALDLGNWPDADAWHASLVESPLVAQGGDIAPLVLSGHRVYLQKLAAMEERVARALAERTCRRFERVDEELLDAGLDREFGPDGNAGNARLRSAARNAVTRGLSVLTGGPGTGKTTALARFLALIAEQFLAHEGCAPRMALAAPTGKAAARMSAAIGAAKRGDAAVPLRCGQEIADAMPSVAGTAHALLGYNPRSETRFAFGRRRPLPFDVIVVDEASMVGLQLMDALLDAAKDTARVILLGDGHQLSSVQAGAVLGDICGGGFAPPWITELERSFRFGDSSPLGEVARLVNAGRPRDVLEALARGGGDDGVALMARDNPKEAFEIAVLRAVALFEGISREAEPARRLEALSEVGVLCAHRNGPLGAVRINREVERRLAEDGRRRPDELWYDGRLVMALRNSHRVGIYNGDLGVACRDRATGGISVCFPAPDGGVRALSPGQVGEHESAFAITVHKSQGSEFDAVVVVLPQAPSPVTTRELLYTAVTRARRRVEIVGRAEVIAAAVETPTARFSGLTDRLYGA